MILETSFIHVADIHLDQSFTTLAAKDGFPALRRKEIFEAFMNVLKRAENEDIDFVLISGDMYEHGYTNIKRINEINEQFKRIKGNIIIISGNHDPEARNSYYCLFQWAKNVHILLRNDPSICFKEQGICFHGIGFDTGGGQIQLLENLKTDEKMINVLLMHGDVDLNISGYNPIDSDILNSKAFDYVAMGHNHRMYVKSNTYNPGSLSPLGFDEPGEHGYFIGDFKSKKAEYVKSEGRKYVDVSINQEKLGLFTEMYPNKSDIYRIRVTGEKDENEISQDLFKEYDFVEVIDTRKIKAPDRTDGFQGIKGEYAKIIYSKLETADEDKKTIYEDALKYGMMALSNERLDIE
jgi:DNA repair exonuclease SbcCD nuclease subunit